MNGRNNEFVGKTGTHKCNNFKVFSASEHVGRITLAKSIAFCSFSVYLNIVFGRILPTSWSLRVLNTFDMVMGGTFTLFLVLI